LANFSDEPFMKKRSNENPKTKAQMPNVVARSFSDEAISGSYEYK
jgi:hypothetical protein